MPGNTKCHPSILNSSQMAPKPGLIVHIKERSLTIRGSAGKFWGKDAIFWAPLGDVRVLIGFVLLKY